MSVTAAELTAPRRSRRAVSAAAAQTIAPASAMIRQGEPLNPLHDLTGDSLSAWHDFRRAWAISEKSATTMAGYGHALAMLARYIGPGAEALYATAGQIEDFLLWVSSTQSAGSRRNRQASLKAWFGWAVKHGLRADNPVTGVPAARKTARPRAILSDDELRALAATVARRGVTEADEFARVRDRAILSLWNEAGSPRVSEMADFQVCDIDLGRDRATIVEGKGGKARVFYLSVSTADALSRYLKARREFAARRRIASEALWLGERGEMTVSGLQRMLRFRGRAAGLHVTPHMLRHTAGHRAKAAGMLPDEAMELFGWSAEAMYLIYGEAGRAERAEARARRAGLADLRRR